MKKIRPFLEKITGDNDRIIDIRDFIDINDFDAIYIDSAYYLVPNKKRNKGYILLRETLKKTNKIGVTKVIVSTKEHLAAVIPYENALLLCILNYDDKIIKLSEFNMQTKKLSAYKITKQEIDMAKKPIQSMPSQRDPENCEDEYQENLYEWIDEDLHNLRHPIKRKSAIDSVSPINFIDLLKKISHTKTKKSPISTKHPPKILARNKRSAKYATRH